MRPLPPALRRRAQATLRVAVPDLGLAGWGIHVFTAAVLALSGGTEASAHGAGFTQQQVLDGLQEYLAAWTGQNQQPRQQLTTENFGFARAVSEMLLGSGLLNSTALPPPAKATPEPARTADNAPGNVAGGGSGGARWYARLFPVWGADPAAFHGLLAKGGCAFSASWADGGVQSPVVAELAFPAWPAPGNATGCALLNPWPSAGAARVNVACGAAAGDGGGGRGRAVRVPLAWRRAEDGDVLSWGSLPVGTKCEVSLE